MYRQMYYLIMLVGVLGLISADSTEAADPNLVGWWKLDEGSGGIAFDSSGHGNDGTLEGGPQWVAGQTGTALDFGGTDGYVDCGNGASLNITDEITLAMWIKTNDAGDGQHHFYFTKGDNSGYLIKHSKDNTILFFIYNDGWYVARTPVDGSFNGVWHHVAGSYDGSHVKVYIDGILMATTEYVGSIDPSPFNVNIGKSEEVTGNFFVDAVIDDARIYSRALTEQEIQQAMKGVPPGSASNPSPAHEATDVPRDVVLGWEPGDFAAPTNGHKVYFGESFDDVNDATGGIAQTAASYTPAQRLDFGKTYYWRVDEVNAPPTSNVEFKGEVWSFTAEPIGYPIEDVNATASSSNSANEGPENTINGSGMDNDDLHSAENKEMWLSSSLDPNAAWIQYEFDKVYKLHQMWVWNHNSLFETAMGFGVRDATIEYSTDGNDYTILDTTHEFAQAPGSAGYAANTFVDFGGVVAKYVKINVNSNWGGIVPQYGLSEVRFLYIPVRAREPQPESGATDVDVDVTLSWKAGREAAKHNVYLSTDEQAVIDGTALVTTVTEASYSTSLDVDSTYYWRIDEVNEAEIPATLEGDIWDFTTYEYFVVEDFEDYNNWSPDEIWATWVDGYEVPANGATVGHPNPDWNAGEHFVETAIVHGGDQSMPLYYDNSTADYSEATVNVANLQVGQDWTKHGVKALTLYFFGDPNNAVEQMYVKVNGSKVTYDGDAENLKRIGWQMWYIDLADFGLDLSNVTELSIGFERIGAFGGQGVVYLDGIRLYSHDRQLITPVDPGTTGLEAHYEFEGTTNDSSGNGRHGTAMGGPTFVAGKVGQAISLDGVDDFVEITGYKGVVGDGSETPPWTVTAWVRTNGNGEVVGWGSTGNGNRMEFRINAGRTRAEGGGGATQGDTTMNDGEWHHIAVTVEPNSTWNNGVDLWLDGQLDTRSNTDPDPWHPTANFDVKIGIRYNGSGRQFTGAIDDVRIYNRVLTEEEIAWLGGRTLPFDKPF